MGKAFNIDTDAVEREYGMGGGGRKNDWFEIREGDNKIRILTPTTVMVSHYSKGGYQGICIGKPECPGCQRDDELTAQKKAEPDEEKAKKIRLTRNIKHLCWVLDYGAIERMSKDPTLIEEEIKLAKLPHTVAKSLKAYQENPEYTFSEAPMPYDVTLNAKGAGTTTVEYTLTAARQNTELSSEILAKVEKLTEPEVIIEKMKDKKKKELGVPVGDSSVDGGAESRSVEYPEEDINPNDIPF